MSHKDTNFWPGQTAMSFMSRSGPNVSATVSSKGARHPPWWLIGSLVSIQSRLHSLLYIIYW